MTKVAKEKDKKEKDKVEQKPRVDKYQSILKCPLTSTELLVYGSEMADKQEESNQLEEALGAIKAEFKAKIEGAGSRINELAAKLRSKSEHRQVPCERTYDYKAATVIERRTDTDAVVHSRVMTVEESQLGLPGMPEGE